MGVAACEGTARSQALCCQYSIDLVVVRRIALYGTTLTNWFGFISRRDFVLLYERGC
jgi:hypothetical protein